MFKKLFLTALLTLSLSTIAQANEDFGQMNETVKITSYKKLFTNNVQAFGSGSGTLISSDGLILSNHHVIFDEAEFEPLDAFEVCITFDVQEEPVCKYSARLIDHDKELDIAILKLNKTDVFGKALPSKLKYKEVLNSAIPKEETEIQVIGYPGSGGETITITKGQISGFEEFNNYKYFKTDTDFDHGSSGGTAVDANGNFIGIPTYIRSYAETVGYFLDLREARDWIAQAKLKKTIVNPGAEALLKKEVARFSKANDTLTYTQDHYPHLSVTLPKGWEFLEINNDSFFASEKNASKPVSFSLFTSNYQYKVDQGYLDKLNEELERIKDIYPDYKREPATFAGQSATKVTYTSFANKNTTYYIPYGYTMMGISYSIDLDEAEKQEAAIQPVLDSIRFTKSPIDEPNLEQMLTFHDPAFTIKSMGNWRLMKNPGKQPRDLLLEGVEKDNYEGAFNLSYSQIAKGERQLSAEKRLDDVTDMLSSQKIINKNDKVRLGGLEGFLFTYEYEGQDYQQIRKHLTMVLKDGDYEFTIEYDDLTEDFDRNLPVIREILNSFRYNGETSLSPSVHNYGNLGFTFNDIQFHRFALAIGDLADKGIADGFVDGGFKPETPIGRAQALKMILDSKNHLEEKKNSGDAVDFENYKRKKRVAFVDVNRRAAERPYVEYAVDEGFVDNRRRFQPNQTVTLVEALKMIIHVYEIPVWAGDTNPWYKKYMDKGFELGLIPRGMTNPGQELTRAELAHLVSTVYKQAKN